MVDQNVITTVLRKMLSSPRHPAYLDNPKYKDLEEPNIEMYMSSAWYASHWSYEKMLSFLTNMLAGRKYFLCALPYQLAIRERLLRREQVENEMSELDFDELKFSMEMEALWYSDADGAFFRFDNITKRRKIKHAMYPYSNEAIAKNDKFKIPPKQIGEIRVMSVDIALMASTTKKNNDASSIIINSAIPNSDNVYISNIVYLENYEGLNTDELGQIVRRLYKIFDIDYIAMDCGGQGLGVYDYCIKTQYDDVTGEEYKPLSCYNDSAMAERCKDKNAPKVIWSIKATEAFNSEMYTLLRSGFNKSKINLLVSEFEAEEILKERFKNFNKLSMTEQIDLKMPYVQTSLLINELIKMEHKITGNKVKLSEKSGERKDRVSSLGYNFYVTTQLELKNLAVTKEEFDVNEVVKLARKSNIYGRRIR